MFKLRSNSTKANNRRVPTLRRVQDNIHELPESRKRRRLVLVPEDSTSQYADANVESVTESIFEAGSDYICERTVAEAEEEAEKVINAEETAVISQFIEALPRLLSLVLQGEAQSSVEEQCSCGRGPRHYTCHDCLQYSLSCEECWIHRHQNLPLHWVLQWQQSEGFYRRLDMACLRNGLHSLQLGHDDQHCPSPDSAQTMTIVHTNGVHGTRIRMCLCNGLPDPVAQCMRMRLFPATLQAPKTFFTFQVLDEFQNHHLVSKKSAYDYLGALRRLTDGAFTNAVQDPYKTFRRATRIWRRLCADKWTGKAYNLSGIFPHRKPDSSIIPCPCCPEDGVNTEPDWERTPKELKHLVQRQFGADGNFHLNRYKKSKEEKEDDLSLLNDCNTGYFPSKENMKNYLAVATRTTEKSTCNYLKVVNNQEKKKFKNMSVTGIVSVTCSHVFVWSSVDLSAGEGFIFTDKALQHAFSHTQYAYDEYHHGSCDDCLAYDCNCQYCVHMHERFAVSCPELLPIVERLRFVIGPLHLQDHKEDCMYRFSAAYLENMAQFNGDSPEQVWGSSNSLGPATRQMNNGHRQDVISAHFSYWNWMKTIGLSQRLATDLLDAREQFKIARATLVSLSALYSKSIPEWKALEERYRSCKIEELPSLYQHHVSAVPSRTSIYRHILARDDKKDTKNTTRSANATFLVEALNIQHAQRRIKGKLTLNQTETVQRDITERRERLATRIKAFRKLQAHLTPTTEEDVAAWSACEPENECLFIPSDYGDVRRREKGLVDLGEVERVLREGDLYDAVAEVRQAARNQSIVRDQKSKNDRGTRANTRSLLQLKTIYVDLLCCIDDYNSTRSALQSLSDSYGDLPEMKEEDTYRRSTVRKRGLGDSRRTDGQLYTSSLLSSPGMEDQLATETPLHNGPPIGTQVIRRKRSPRKLKGKKKKTKSANKKTVKDGWIWQPKVLLTRIHVSSKDQREYERECDRVQWHRAKAERDRWQECLEKTEADFRNSIRYFSKMNMAWTTVASGSLASGDIQSELSFGHRAFARRQAHIYQRLQNDAQDIFRNLGLKLELPSGEILADSVRRTRAQIIAADEASICKLIADADAERQRLKEALGEVDYGSDGDGEHGESDGDNENSGNESDSSDDWN